MLKPYETVSIPMEYEDQKKLQAEADRLNMSLDIYVNRVLEEYIFHNGKHIGIQEFVPLLSEAVKANDVQELLNYTTLLNEKGEPVARIYPVD